MNYTKGEWKIGYRGWSATPVVFVDSEVPIVIADCGQDGRIADDTRKSNAQLITATPDLYEALKVCRDYIEHNYANSEIEDAANKALAKAEGK